MARRKQGDWYHFVVEGWGEFPFDMLRYDSCWPVREGSDSGQLSGFERGRRRVMLASQWQGAPTKGRWASFTWKVVAEGDSRGDLERWLQDNPLPEKKEVQA